VVWRWASDKLDFIYFSAPIFYKKRAIFWLFWSHAARKHAVAVASATIVSHVKLNPFSEWSRKVTAKGNRTRNPPITMQTPYRLSHQALTIKP